MKAVIFASLLVIILLSTEVVLTKAEGLQAQQPCTPPLPAGGQTLPPSTSLTVEVCATYSYKAQDGTTVVLGEVQNNNDFPITNVKIGITFEDINSNVIEYKTGTTLLQVVQPQSKAPFSISSTKAYPSITQVSAILAGFVSASPKDQLLVISPEVLQISDTLALSGTIKNGGNSAVTNTKLYLISYDAFQRVVAIGTTTIPNITAGNMINFTITSTPSFRAKSYAIVAESDQYQSTIAYVTNVLISLPVVISDTQVTDPNGTKFSTIPVGSTVKITSDLKYLASKPQPYVFYVQVKQFGGKVEFIGTSHGVFLGPGDQPSVTWKPDVDGQYYIETYVWDSGNVPLSSAGTRINVVLVKS
jgi:hypothetical protein